MTERTDEFEGAATTAINFLEVGLRAANERRERNKQIYKELLRGLGNPSELSPKGSWVPDEGQSGEAIQALEGYSRRRINPRFLSLNPYFTVPVDSEAYEMLLSSKVPYLRNGVEVSAEKAVPVICLEGAMLQKYDQGERRVITSHILDQDGNTRVVGVYRDWRLSIPKAEYWETEKRVPEDLWENVLKFANGKWRKDPVLLERVQIRPQAVPMESTRQGFWNRIGGQITNLIKRSLP